MLDLVKIREDLLTSLAEQEEQHETFMAGVRAGIESTFQALIGAGEDETQKANQATERTEDEASRTISPMEIETPNILGC